MLWLQKGEGKKEKPGEEGRGEEVEEEVEEEVRRGALRLQNTC